jgi:hypothetical protein
MSRARPALGIAFPKIAETYSVCKLFDVDPKAPEYLSVAALVYAHISGRVSMVDIKIINLEVKRVVSGFCGRGPAGFQELSEVSGKFLEESRTPRRLVCQEGFKALEDAIYFVTSHLWLEARLERYEAMGALEDASEIVHVCLGVSP